MEPGLPLVKRIPSAHLLISRGAAVLPSGRVDFGPGPGSGQGRQLWRSMPLPHPHDHLVRQLQASADPRDQALAVLLVDSDEMKTAVFGERGEPEEGLVGRVTLLERFRTNLRLAITVAIPTVLSLIFAGVAAARHVRELGQPAALPGRTTHE